MTPKYSILSLMTLALTLIIAFTSALPTPVSTPSIFRFPINTPKMDTLWLIDSLPKVSWDTTEMPKGSTMDIALLHHAKKQSILLRRYVPTRLGSTLVNLGPELQPGTYSLLLTVFKGRTSTVVGRSLVQSIILIDDVSTDPEQESVEETPEATTSAPSSDKKNKEDEFLFKKQKIQAIQETEQVVLTHQPTKNNLVLRAPYTVGWTIPKPLEGAKSRVNILLVSGDAREGDKTVRVLATNIDAQVGFMYVFLPEDVPLKAYHIKIEIVGKGRKFSGYTHKFFTSLPAFSSRA
ncbi:hypothetical protein BGZ74_007766 [Mortierella antarctica]|nr:hypothetical protein BGZ74_007766 [Mortierella antarctica]